MTADFMHLSVLRLRYARQHGRSSGWQGYNASGAERTLFVKFGEGEARRGMPLGWHAASLAEDA